jgi:hypothetical protein
MTSESFLVTPDHAAKRANIRINRIVHTAFDTFEINETRWKVRFQSWPRKPQEGDPTLELGDDFPVEEPRFEQGEGRQWFANLPLEQKLAQMEIDEAHRRAVRQNTTGWHLRRGAVAASRAGLTSPSCQRIKRKSPSHPLMLAKAELFIAASFTFGNYRSPPRGLLFGITDEERVRHSKSR